MKKSIITKAVFSDVTALTQLVNTTKAKYSDNRHYAASIIGINNGDYVYRKGLRLYNMQLNHLKNSIVADLNSNDEFSNVTGAISLYYYYITYHQPFIRDNLDIGTSTTYRKKLLLII